jgi:hypothetical protein
VKRAVPLMAGLLMAVNTMLAPSSAGASNASESRCRNGRYFSVALKVDRDRLKTHKKDRRLVRVIIKNPCGGYSSTGWGHGSFNSDDDRVMIVIGPGVKVDWKADDFAKVKLSRDFNWAGNGPGPDTSLAAIRCVRPTHLLENDHRGKPRLSRYKPDTTGCP